MECGDPFRSIGEQYGKIEKRECPAYERCAKITGSNSRGEGYIIRDCYRTISFDAKLGLYPHSVILKDSLDLLKKQAHTRTIRSSTTTTLWMGRSIFAMLTSAIDLVT
jgi:hypothetical protein